MCTRLGPVRVRCAKYPLLLSQLHIRGDPQRVQLGNATTAVGYSKTRYKKLVIHVESHASAMSLIERAEQRYIKAIIIITNTRP